LLTSEKHIISSHSETRVAQTPPTGPRLQSYVPVCRFRSSIKQDNMPEQSSDQTTENLILPHRQLLRDEKGKGQKPYIAGPNYDSFTSRFGDAFPAPRFLESDLGVTAVYDLGTGTSSSSSESGARQDAKRKQQKDDKDEQDVEERKGETRRVLIVHGLNTPALGLLPLARAIQALGPDTNNRLKTKTHIVLFDLWGHGLSSTPLTPHSAHIFHSQIYQVLSLLRWSTCHVIGYSFGACLAAKFAFYNPSVAQSVTLLAPAGVLPREVIGDELLGLLENPSDNGGVEEGAGQEKEREGKVLEFLEGGKLHLPSDWQDRMNRGEIVAEALRWWELDQHKGYRKSVLSMFRESGNVFGAEDFFRRFASATTNNHNDKNDENNNKENGLGMGFGKVLVVLGGRDDICSKEQLVELGFEAQGIEIVVIEDAHHGVVRSHTESIARVVTRLWEGEEGGE